MLRERIIRAWKDPEYRTTLSEDDLAEMPENPAGAIELTDDELEMAAGGSWGGSAQRPSSSSSSSSQAMSSSSSSNNSSNSSSNSSSNASSNSSSNSSSNASSSSSMSSRQRLQPYTTRGPSYSSSGKGYARWR